MKLRVSIKFAVAVAVVSLCFETDVVKADEATFQTALFGKWRDPKTGDSYRFNRNQTYEFRAGPQKSKSGNLSHGGAWSVYNPDPEMPLNFKPFGLRLSATHRKILRRGAVVNRRAHRVFEMLFQRDYVSFPRGVPVYLSRNGRYYYREPNHPQNVHWIISPEAKNPNGLFIESTRFVRVR